MKLVIIFILLISLIGTVKAINENNLSLPTSVQIGVLEKSNVESPTFLLPEVTSRYEFTYKQVPYSELTAGENDCYMKNDLIIRFVGLNSDFICHKGTTEHLLSLNVAFVVEELHVFEVKDGEISIAAVFPTWTIEDSHKLTGAFLEKYSSFSKSIYYEDGDEECIVNSGLSRYLIQSCLNKLPTLSLKLSNSPLFFRLNEKASFNSSPYVLPYFFGPDLFR